MKETSQTTRSNGAPSAAGSDSADVGALDHRDPVVGAQTPGKLSVAHIQRHHAGGTRLQQAVREPAGARTHVDRPPPRNRHREPLERARELVAASRYEAGTRGDLDDSRQRLPAALLW